jgi:hypothetical protein
MQRWASWALIALVCAGCDSAGSAAAQAPVPAGPGEGVLFVGNSLTFANDLPTLVQSLGTAVGHPLPTAMVAKPDYALGDHLSQGDAERSIATGGWRVVVLQQGPSSLDESRVLLRRWTVTFDQRIRAVGARTALFSVWAESTRTLAFWDVAESYSLAAQDVGGIYLPATQAWLEAWNRDPSLKLYAADGYHPSQQGTYLSALVIAGVLTGVSPDAMPSRIPFASGGELVIPEPAATVLRAAATAAVSSSARP